MSELFFKGLDRASLTSFQRCCKVREPSACLPGYTFSAEHGIRTCLPSHRSWKEAGYGRGGWELLRSLTTSFTLKRTEWSGVASSVGRGGAHAGNRSKSSLAQPKVKETSEPSSPRDMSTSYWRVAPWESSENRDCEPVTAGLWVESALSGLPDGDSLRFSLDSAIRRSAASALLRRLSATSAGDDKLPLVVLDIGSLTPKKLEMLDCFSFFAGGSLISQWGDQPSAHKYSFSTNISSITTRLQDRAGATGVSFFPSLSKNPNRNFWARHKNSRKNSRTLTKTAERIYPDWLLKLQETETAFSLAFGFGPVVRSRLQCTDFGAIFLNPWQPGNLRWESISPPRIPPSFSHLHSRSSSRPYYRKRGSASYYRKRGSASYIVREWLLWVVERERETPVTSSISRWNREWSCIWLPRQRVDPMHMHTGRRVLSLHLLSSARSAWQAKTTNSNSCDRAVAQVKYRSTYPNNLGEGTASTEEISKKGIKLILKTIGNRKGDCAWSCSRGQTQPEKICKLQSTNQ